MDTIFALSSGAPPAAIGVMRLSGPGALAAVKRLAGRLPKQRNAALRDIRDPENGALLDRALVLVFPGPASVTGEDVVELHLHGGRAIVVAVERVLSAMPGLRRAEPGEFTRRALMAGRIDLTEAEGLGDLLLAETEAQRQMAMLIAEGGVRRRIEAWNGRAVAIAADLEAAIDFSDEDDVPALALNQLHKTIAQLASEIDNALEEPPVERLRDGIRVVIAGPPNSGKSTLLNVLVDRDAAIVTDIAGTTRDVIEVAAQRDGVSYLMLDTAGIRENPTDAVEVIGIQRAIAATEAAEIVLWLGDDMSVLPDALLVWVHSRADEPGREVLPPEKHLAVSAHTSTGISELWVMIRNAADALLPRPDRAALNRRQRDLLAVCTTALKQSIMLDDIVLMAEELRNARRAFDAITGRADTESVLDSVFARFCIGK